jgi:hypothetical protein
MNTRPPLYLYPPSRLSIVQMPIPTTTQGGQLDDQLDELEEIHEVPVRADRARFADHLAAQTRIAPDVAIWTALCVHGRAEVTWFRAPHAQADHHDCGCPDAAAGTPGMVREPAVQQSWSWV